MEIVMENGGGKIAKRSRVRHDRRRIARREQEAERWAQARLQGIEQGPIPTNTAGLKYLYVHYPWLLPSSEGYDPKKCQPPPQKIAADTQNGTQRQDIQSNTDPSTNSQTNIGLGRKDSEDLTSCEKESSSTQWISKSHCYKLPEHDHKVGSIKEDTYSSVDQPSVVDSSKRPSTTKPINSFQPNFTNTFASKTQSTGFLRAATPKLPSPQKANASVYQNHASNPSTANGFIHKSLNMSGNSSGTLHKSASSGHKNFAILPRSERLKVLTATATQRIGRLAEDRDLEKCKDSMAHMQEAIPKDVNPQMTATGLLHDLQLRHSSTDNINSEGRYDLLVQGREDLEANVVPVNKPTPRVVLPPAQQDIRMVPKRINTPTSVSHHGTCSTYSQSLRATAPVFVPKASSVHSKIGASQAHIDSPLVAPSPINTMGSQPHDVNSRLTTASSSTTSSKIALFPCLLERTFVSGSQSNGTAAQKLANSECRCLVKFPAYYRLISNGSMVPVNIQSNIGNMEYMSDPNSDGVHTARSLFALEVTRRATGLTAEELLSFLAVSVPCVNQVNNFPQVMKEIHSKSDTLRKCHLSRYFTSSPQRLHVLDCPYSLLTTTLNGEIAAQESDMIDTSKPEKTKLDSDMEKKASWQAEDFQGYRVIPRELRLMEEGYNLSNLAAQARISLCKPGTEAYARKRQEMLCENRTVYKENYAKQTISTDEKFVHASEAQDNDTYIPFESSDLVDDVKAWELDARNSNVNINQTNLRDYKELAAMSDIDSTASENGEHDGNEFFVKKAASVEEQQSERNDSQKDAVTASSSHLQPVRCFEPAPPEVYQEHTYPSHQVPMVHQEQYSQFLVSDKSLFTPQMQPVQFAPDFYPQPQYQHPYQFPPHHHWQWQWQHRFPVDSYYLNDCPVPPKHRMTRQDLENLRRRYSELQF